MTNMITKEQIKQAIIKKKPKLTAHEFNKLVYNTYIRAKMAERAKYAPAYDKDVMLYRQRGALGVATAWAYVDVPVDSFKWEPCGFYSAKTDTLNYGLEEWEAMQNVGIV